MKKFLSLLIIFFSIQTTQSIHNLYIINHTKKTLIGVASMQLPPPLLVPQNKKFTIKPERTVIIDSKGYCFNGLTVRPLDGWARTKITSKGIIYLPLISRLGMHCKDLEVKIIELKDNTLTIEGPKLPQGLYTAHIFNESHLDVHVSIDLNVAGFCGNIFEIIKAGENKKISLGGCCTKSVLVRPITTDPHIIKEEYPFALPKTGLHERCGSFNLFIRQTSDGKRLILKDAP